MPLRVFIVSYMLAYGLFSSGPLRSRLGLMAGLVVAYLFFCSVIDFTALLFQKAFGVPPSLILIEILSGLIGYLVYAFKLLEWGNMPSRIPIEGFKVESWVYRVRLMLVVLIAAMLTLLVSLLLMPGILTLRSMALLGGIGPGVMLFFPFVFIILYFVARRDTARVDQEDFAPPLTIIIPAHNEAHIIAQTIASIDLAADNYQGPVSILVMDNNSRDTTSAVAADALSKCLAALGRVIAEEKPGKSHALNAALDATQTEFVIRIDADTQIGRESLKYAMNRMKEPKVGVVGGLPIPPGTGRFDRPRLLETLVKHGFYSVGLSAVNSVVGVPGMFAAYRTELPRKLGGFVQGMNGEDTDMSLRIGELGHRLVVDPRIQFISEVPTTFAHLREQRLRWFRSVFHVSARCRDLIYSKRPSVRGKVMLPFMLMGSAMRAMMVPMILFGILLYISPGLTPRDLPWQAILAVITGAPAMMAVLCALLNKRPKAVLYVPEYLLFRILRAYFTLESNLTITVKAHREHLYSKSGRIRPAGKQDRQA